MTLFDDPQKKLSPARELAEKEVPLVKLENNVIEILVNNPGDHPTLITIDLSKRQYDVEGYD